MEIQRIKLSALVQNNGQLEGLPRNPREWTAADIERLAASIEETPELLEARPLIAIENGKGKSVVLGGNLRLAALRKLGAADAPVALMPADTPIDKLREIVIKDNGSFGSWDYDSLANEWDDLPLTDWGVPAWEAPKGEGDFGTEFSLPNGEKEPYQQMAFTLADEQAREVQEALDEAKGLEEYKSNINYGNTNSNGNALALIIEQWLQQRK